MVDFQALPADVVGCFGRTAALDPLASTVALSVRVAPDELLCLGAHHRLPELESQLASLDPGGVVVDLSGGYSIWAMRGDDRFEAFSRLSELELPAAPAAVIQGLVAQVPMKVLVLSDKLLLVVSSVLAHHLQERLARAFADLLDSEAADVLREQRGLVEVGEETAA